MFKKIFIFCLATIAMSVSNAQVGVDETNPQAALHVNSANSGVLIPRVALNSLTDNTTVVNPNGGALAVSTLVYNTGAGGLTEAGFFFWSGISWIPLMQPQVNTGMQFYSWDIANTVQPDINNPRDILNNTTPPLITPNLSGSYNGLLRSVEAFPVTNPSGDNDGFIICFIGTYEVSNGGVFNFELTSNDGSRLYVDDILVVDNWTQGRTVLTGDVNLAPGKHRFEFWYYEFRFGNSFAFRWGANPDGNSGLIRGSEFTVE